MPDIYIKPLCIGLVLSSCLLAWTHSRHMPGRFDAQYAGRSEKEFRDVQSTVRDLEMTILKSRMSDSEAEAVIQDENSEAYKNILSGKIGDILLTSRDAKLWLDAAKGSKRRKRKIYNFEEYPSRKWDLPIKYDIDTYTLSNVTEQDIIEKALKGWEKETCVRFERASQFSTEQHLYFIQTESRGCSSYIGKAGYREMLSELEYSRDHQQPVHLAKECFDSMGTVMHEIGHALGLYHEAQRLDRDEHVIVRKWNVISDDLSNFLQPVDRSVIETKGLPYDIGSLMHYSALDFSIDEEDFMFTILPYNTDKVFVLGQRVEIGFYDAEAINLAYCPVSNTLVCSNGGYTDPNNESQCKCPAGWQGTLCTKVQEGALGCSPLSGFIDHHDADYGQTFSLYSPNYRNPVNWQYEKGDECYWYLQVPSKYQIVWWIGHDSDNSGTGFFLGLPFERSGCQFWLEVKTPDEVRGIRTCMLLNDTSSRLTNPHLSNSHKLLVSFRTFSEFYLAMDDVFLRGFHLQYELRLYTPQTTRDPYFRDKIDSLQSTYRPPFWQYTPKFRDYTTGINFTATHNSDEYGYTSDNEDHLSAGAIIGISLACIVAFGLKGGCIMLRVRRSQKVIVRRQILIEEHVVPRSPVANTSGQPGPSHVTTTTPSPSSTIPSTAPPSYESAISSGTPQVNNQYNRAPQGTVTGTSINSRPRPVATGPAGIMSLKKGDFVVIRTSGRVPPATNRSQSDNAETPAPSYSNRPLSLLRVNPSLLNNS